MNEEWTEYYQFLEALRESGVTNMFGAVPYLREYFEELDETTARKVLSSWMNNYSELAEKFGWRN